MGWFTDLTGFVAPFFIVMSPILSYSDQAISMHRNKSSAGFSLDIPLIMLVASFLRSESPDETPPRTPALSGRMGEMGEQTRGSKADICFFRPVP